MKKLVLPLGVLAMLGLIGAAAAIDCVRLAADERWRVDAADEEMHRHEQRLVELLDGFSRRSPELDAALAAHRRAGDLARRHTAYAQVVSSFRQTLAPAIDPTHPLDRKFLDNVSGAINRREIAQQAYDDELAAYQDYLGSWRGRLARACSQRARDDWTADD